MGETSEGPQCVVKSALLGSITISPKQQLYQGYPSLSFEATMSDSDDSEAEEFIEASSTLG
jgi:hypothetical protein